MDKSLYLNMNGAHNAMRRLEVITNNLANVNTNGFRADASFTDAYKTPNSTMDSRVYAKFERTFTDFNPGSIMTTDRDLDVAIQGQGFIAVQTKTGKEGQTRDGSFQIRDGFLTSRRGDLVLGNSGAIAIPSSEKIHISDDGTVSVKLTGQMEMVVVDRIKLTNPNVSNIKKGEDGLFYPLTDGSVQSDNNVKLISRSLESSNVNAIDAMTQLVDLSRHYQIHTTFMKTVSDNTSKSNQLLDITK